MKALVTITYAKDYGWLRHCAKSVARFMTGFDRWFIWVPKPIHESVLQTQREYDGKIPLTVKWFDEWPAKGMMHREWIIVDSDEFMPGYTSFTHLDADNILTSPLSADSFFRNGKPMLPVRPCNEAVVKHCGHWLQGVKDAIGIYPETDGMGWMPLTYRPTTLVMARKLIRDHTKLRAMDYIRSCRNEYPQTFAEFNTLSYVAWKFNHSLYEFVEGGQPWGPAAIQHFWSHGGIDRPMDDAPRVVNGKSYTTPRQMIGDFGFL